MAKVVLPLDRLMSSTRTHFPKRFASAVARLPGVKELIFTPFPGVKTISVRGGVEGSGSEEYKVILTFSDVSYSDEKDEVHVVPIQITPKKKMFMEPISPKNRAQVRCSCPDFYYVFGYWDWTKGAIYGVKPRPYKRLTTTRPEVNPAHAVGMCKHILACWLRMRRSKFVRS